MFPPETYINRRAQLKKKITSGLILFIGNDDIPMNFKDNHYDFRQDGSFLYYWGIDMPGRTAVIDVENDRDLIFGDDYAMDDIIWMGAQTQLEEWARKSGAHGSLPADRLKPFLEKAAAHQKNIHYLPQYRTENRLKIADLTGIPHTRVNRQVSHALLYAVIEQRLIKSGDEVLEIEKALEITREMFDLAMELTEPGIFEYEVISWAEGLALSRNSRLAYHPIFSTRGERLHGSSHANRMEQGDLAIMDVGVESPMKYASDVTRSFPVSKIFSSPQKEVYDIVWRANEAAIEMMAPGVCFRDVHLHAAGIITSGLQQMGLMKGCLEDSVEQGAHALFFPHGLGHPLGLEIHDMESLGEDHVGYDREIQRSNQFGLSNLRFGKRLEKDMTMTVEPGIYFIPELIRQWQGKGLCRDFIQYDRLEAFMEFGGIRIEDDILITETGTRNLSVHIPKKISDIEILP